MVAYCAVQCSVVVLSLCQVKHTGFRHKRRNCSELKKELINSAETSEREKERELFIKLKEASEGCREKERGMAAFAVQR